MAFDYESIINSSLISFRVLKEYNVPVFQIIPTCHLQIGANEINIIRSTPLKLKFWNTPNKENKHGLGAPPPQKKKNKLGLSWAKLSCQLGFGCTVINICCCILIYLK